MLLKVLKKQLFNCNFSGTSYMHAVTFYANQHYTSKILYNGDWLSYDGLRERRLAESLVDSVVYSLSYLVWSFAFKGFNLPR